MDIAVGQKASGTLTAARSKLLGNLLPFKLILRITLLKFFPSLRFTFYIAVIIHESFINYSVFSQLQPRKKLFQNPCV